MRILVLEDEVLVALDLEDELRARGHEVIGPASTLAEAERLADAVEPDLALLDINVRGQVPRALAEELRRREIPFVYVSGYDEDFIKAHLPHAPMLPKPMRPSALGALLRGVAAQIRSLPQPGDPISDGATPRRGTVKPSNESVASSAIESAMA